MSLVRIYIYFLLILFNIFTTRCINKVHEYQQSSEVTLQLDTMNYTQPHHLPTQQQTGEVTQLNSVR